MRLEQVLTILLGATVLALYAYGYVLTWPMIGG